MLRRGNRIQVESVTRLFENCGNVLTQEGANLIMDSRIQIVVAVIEQDLFSRTLCSERLAQLVNLSPSRLQHLFKAETGETLLNHLKSTRMQAAEILMRTEFLSGKEVMSRVGLLNYSNFIHDFKRAYGLAPGRYRALMRR
jgi:AraC family transcriptional regulator of arabinose operon